MAQNTIYDVMIICPITQRTTRTGFLMTEDVFHSPETANYVTLCNHCFCIHKWRETGAFLQQVEDGGDLRGVKIGSLETYTPLTP